MAISNELMLAILAMDAYNRDYGAGLVLGGTQIGTATLASNSSVLVDAGGSRVDQPASFFAQAYTLADGRTVISYRGTDDPFTDVVNGYGIGAGQPTVAATQGQMAVEFYRSVLEGADPRSANIAFTGHSLGGGLAGYVAALYGRQGVLFDQMPFQSAAEKAFALSVGYSDPVVGTIDDPALRQAIYGNDAPWAPSVAGISSHFIPAAGGLPWTNFLAAFRTDPALQNTARYELPPDTNLSWSWYNKVGERHDAALIVIRMFFDGPGQPTGDWRYIANEILSGLYVQDLAKAIGGLQFAGPGAQDDAALVLRSAIAYSALDSGERPFGDSAIRAMFNDADELGRVYSGSPNRLLDDQLIAGVATVKQGLADIAVQYAGDLALQAASDAESKAGVFELLDGGARLKADLDPQKWRATFNLGIGAGSNNLVNGEEKIVGLEKIATALVATMLTESSWSSQAAMTQGRRSSRPMRVTTIATSHGWRRQQSRRA